MTLIFLKLIFVLNTKLCELKSNFRYKVVICQCCLVCKSSVESFRRANIIIILAFVSINKIYITLSYFTVCTRIFASIFSDMFLRNYIYICIYIVFYFLMIHSRIVVVCIINSVCDLILYSSPDYTRQVRDITVFYSFVLFKVVWPSIVVWP